jgi:hypothetical protein
MFRLIIQCLGKGIKEASENGDKLNSNDIYAAFVGDVLLLGSGENFWGSRETEHNNFMRRRLDPESDAQDSDMSYQQRFVKKIVFNIKHERMTMFEKLSEKYVDETMITAIWALINRLHKGSDFADLKKETEYPKSKLRSLVDSMESCLIANKSYSSEVTPLDTYDKLLDLILFILEITVIGEKTSNTKLLFEKSSTHKAILNNDEEKVICMLNLFKNRTAKFRYKIFYNNEWRLKTSVLNLIKKGIVFISAEETFTLSPPYWASSQDDAEIQNMLMNIVTELHSALRSKAWNQDLFREDLIAIAPNIRCLQNYLNERLLFLYRKQSSPSDNEMNKMLDTEDLLFQTENMLLFAGIAVARNSNDKDIFIDTFEHCNLLLNTRLGIDKELRQAWKKLRRECEPYTLQQAPPE